MPRLKTVTDEYFARKIFLKMFQIKLPEKNTNRGVHYYMP